jgi:hypothetical protein
VKIVGEQARVLATVTTSEGTEESVELFAEVVDPPREDEPATDEAAEPADEASDPDVEAAGNPETGTEDGEAVEGEPVEVDGGEPR